jgi:SAM-dependent methyltransferase
MLMRKVRSRVISAREVKKHATEREFHEVDARSNIQSEQTKGITGFFYGMYIRDSRRFAVRFKHKTILDIGAGDGIILANTGLQPIEMDISTERCLRLKEKQEYCVCGSGFNLPVKDGSIDACLLIAMLEHTSRPECVIDEVHRVLRSGGEAAILVPNDITMSVGRILLLKYPPRYPGHLSFITPRGIKRWLKGRFLVKQEYTLPFRRVGFWLSLYYFIYVQKK